jgi:hypothetical protein
MATSKSTAVAKAKVNLPANIQQQFADEVANLQKRISAPSGDRITVTQGKTFKLPNGLEVDELEGVVVEFVAANHYYTTDFDRNNIVPPECFAIGLEPAGLVPSDNSPAKQSESCAACWANQFKSARNGRGKACANSRLLAILPLDADVSTQPMVLKVSATGLRSFDAHAASAAQAFGVPVRGVITKITFSDDEWASLRFAVAGRPDKELLALAQAAKEGALQRLLVEPDVTAAKAEKPVAVHRAPARGKAAAPARAAR